MQAPLNQNLVRQYKAQWLPNINNHTNFHFDLNVDPREKMQALYSGLLLYGFYKKYKKLMVTRMMLKCNTLLMETHLTLSNI